MSNVINRIGTRIANLFKFGFVSQTNDDSSNLPYVQVQYFDEKTINSVMTFPYGMSAMPPVETMLVMKNICGQEDNSVCMPFATKERFKNLKPGEVIIGSPVSKAQVKFLADGSVEILSGSSVSTSIKLLANGGVEINGATEIKLTCPTAVSLTAPVTSINSPSMSFFGTDAFSRQPGGAMTAGTNYTTNEQTMLQKVYDAVRKSGLML